MQDFNWDGVNEDEAIAIFSALGFSMRDWPFIKKIGAMNLLASDVMNDFIQSKVSRYPYLSYFLKNLRHNFDRFYESKGVLIAPNKAPALFRFPEAPLIFYSRGNNDLLSRKPVIAIVGSRKASTEALAISRRLAQTLAFSDVTTVSGGARGIDEMAHLGSLDGKGATIVVSPFPCPLESDVRTKAWAFNNEDRLQVIYPIAPITPLGKYMFVERNRYVVSLADALVILQGKKNSGTLHTAAFAEQLGLPIWVMPGMISDPLAYVPNQLLAQGKAKALIDLEQFAQFFTPKRAKSVKKDSPMINPPDLAKLGLLQLIRQHDNALTFDELLTLSGKPFAELQKELLSHELAGQVKKRGAQFVFIGN